MAGARKGKGKGKARARREGSAREGNCFHGCMLFYQFMKFGIEIGEHTPYVALFIYKEYIPVIIIIIKISIAPFLIISQ